MFTYTAAVQCTHSVEVPCVGRLWWPPAQSPLILQCHYPQTTLSIINEVRKCLCHYTGVLHTLLLVSPNRGWSILSPYQALRAQPVSDVHLSAIGVLQSLGPGDSVDIAHHVTSSHVNRWTRSQNGLSSGNEERRQKARTACTVSAWRLSWPVESSCKVLAEDCHHGW